MLILVAEDDPMTRALLTVTLEGAGHAVLAVEDGAAAWDAIERLAPQLVVLDWQMPHLDGLEVCRRIRASEALGRSTFVLVLTGRDASADLSIALGAGADDYVTKPFDPMQLQARIQIAEERIAQNEARWRAEEQLAHARWLAGVGETVVAVQHQINNPLASVMAYASLCTMEPDLTPDLKEMLEVIVAESRRIAAVMKKLGHLGRPKSVEYAVGARMVDLAS